MVKPMFRYRVEEHHSGWRAISEAGNVGRGRSPGHAVAELELVWKGLPVIDLEAPPKYPENEHGFIAKTYVTETKRAIYRQWIWEPKES